MRSGKWIAVLAGISAAALLHGELQQWVQHTPAGDWLKAFFESGVRKPPAETRPALSALITANPKEAALYRLRAHEAELQLDFVAAEADWRRYAQLAEDSGGAWLELADYFDRRHQPAAEVDALRIVGRAASDRFAPPASQRSWQSFERALRVISEQALPDSSTIAIYRAWIARYPQEAAVRQRFIGFLAGHKIAAAANEQLAAYKKSFPSDSVYPIKASAELAAGSGSRQSALAIYEREFQALWPDDLTTSYFKRLEESSELRAMVAKSRAQLAANPDDLREAGRLFAYWRRQNNAVAARRVLDEYRNSKQSRKAVWTADQLYTMAQLFERLPDTVEAAGLYYQLYSLPGADAYYAEQSLIGLANLLLKNPQQPVRFGSADLSFYRDIATMDRSPGFLNGILSLILNGTGPRWEYARQDSTSLAYFHRCAAAQLVDLLDRRFPRSAARASLHAQVIQAYNTYGDDDTVIRTGREFLTAFPDAGERVDVGLTVADALARRKRQSEEFALYDRLLTDLARRADGMPLGRGQARSPDYARVLDRYLARLSAEFRTLDAVQLYRREIDHNPLDPGLYERLSAFVDHNNLSAETEAIYKQAIARFGGTSWSAKLARWYLRREQRAEVDALTRQLVATFSGLELERYFAEIGTARDLGPVLYRQVNLYAHDRFPDDLVFVRNLLSAYTVEATRDDAAYEDLLRQFWYYDAELRNRYFQALSGSGKLEEQLAAARSATDAASAQFLAEGEAWRSHFEQAAPIMKKVAEAFPGDRSLTSRAAALYRSLATSDAGLTTSAVTLARLETRADPKNRDALAAIGDVYADHGRLSAARLVWDQMPATAPGKVDAWNDTATIFWDYYLYDDALRVIQTARVRRSDPSLLAYQAGAIYEGKRQDEKAVGEYVSGSLAGDQQAEGRLLKLARRPALHNTVDRLTAETVARPGAEWPAVALRISVLQQQQRKPEIAQLLATRIDGTRSPDQLRKLEEAAAEFPDVRQRAIERQISVTQDPVERMRLRIALARFLESRKNLTDAARTIETLVHDEPRILGVIRAAVDFYTRNQLPGDAIRILTASAGYASDSYRDQFTIEAARVATGARRFDEARTLIQPLLARSPYNTEYLSAMAATYLQAGDDARYRDYQLATIKSLRAAPLPPADRTARIAAMRRDLIPALTRLRNYPDAVDQYIAVIDSYPEDEILIREASVYAARYSLGDRLTGFYRKTITDAPRDYRWPMVLARIDTALEDFPDAIAAYDAALHVRPDRKDLVAEREALEERTLDFERAIASCRTLFDLSYHDPQWMQRSASLHARLGQRAEAVRDLQAGFPVASSADEIARQLDQWDYTADAARYVGRAERFDTGLWARVMVRARRLGGVLAKLPAMDGPKANAAIAAAGQAIRDYYTPEEKAAAEPEIRQLTPPLQLALAAAAELTQLEAEVLNAQLAIGDASAERSLTMLEERRGQFGQLASSLETYAAFHGIDQQTANRALIQAANAWHVEGDRANESRLLAELYARGQLSGAMQNRYFSLIAPARLVQLSRQSYPAVFYAIRHGEFSLARNAIQARGSTISPLWSNAYTALAGIYDEVHIPEVDGAFLGTLGGGTIGERIAHRTDPALHATGKVWFYYGARYGEYLGRAAESRAADFLPAEVESTPGDPLAYYALGGFYEEQGLAERAITQYQAVLQLDPDRGEAENAIARVLWHQNRRQDAIAHWRAALAAFDRVENRGVRVPTYFWSSVAETVGEIGHEKQITVLESDLRKLLAGYININGEYMTSDLLSPALRACLESGADFHWLLDLASINYWLLNTLNGEPLLTPQQHEEIARRLVDLAARDMEETYTARLNFLEMLLDHGNTAEAERVWLLLSPEQREQASSRVVELKLAGFNDSLDALLARYQAQPDTAPQFYEIVQATDFLRQHSHAAAARKILAFAYQREIDEERFAAANFLGLAGIYLETGDNDRAVQILRRMTLISGEEFETFGPAATLLAEHGQTAAAVSFLRDRVRAVPWDHNAQLQLARLLPGDDGKTAAAALVNDSEARYTLRAAAAQRAQNPEAGSGDELALLQRGGITTAEARKPFYVEARLAAGLSREALAIRPSDLAVQLAALKTALGARQDAMALAIFRHMASEPFLERFPVDKAERAQIALAISEACEREGNLADAMRYAMTASFLGLEMTERQNRLKAEERELAENARRAPLVREIIEQDHVVRPRIARRPS